MTMATASTPFYFKPAIINDHIYISGDNIALSPANFAFFYANERLQIPESDIHVTSIGAVNTVPQEMDETESVLEVAMKILEYTAPSKKHT